MTFATASPGASQAGGQGSTPVSFRPLPQSFSFFFLESGFVAISCPMPTRSLFPSNLFFGASRKGTIFFINFLSFIYARSSTPQTTKKETFPLFPFCFALSLPFSVICPVTCLFFFCFWRVFVTLSFSDWCTCAQKDLPSSHLIPASVLSAHKKFPIS